MSDRLMTPADWHRRVRPASSPAGRYIARGAAGSYLVLILALLALALWSGAAQAQSTAEPLYLGPLPGLGSQNQASPRHAHAWRLFQDYKSSLEQRNNSQDAVDVHQARIDEIMAGGVSAPGQAAAAAPDIQLRDAALAEVARLDRRLDMLRTAWRNNNFDVLLGDLSLTGTMVSVTYADPDNLGDRTQVTMELIEARWHRRRNDRAWQGAAGEAHPAPPQDQPEDTGAQAPLDLSGPCDHLTGANFDACTSQLYDDNPLLPPMDAEPLSQ